MATSEMSWGERLEAELADLEEALRSALAGEDDGMEDPGELMEAIASVKRQME